MDRGGTQLLSNIRESRIESWVRPRGGVRKRFFAVQMDTKNACGGVST